MGSSLNDRLGGQLGHRLSDRLLHVGLCVWLAGAMIGEGLAFAGIGITALGLVMQRRLPSTAGIVAWLAFTTFALTSALWAIRPVRSGAPWSALHWVFFPLALFALERMRERVWLIRVFVAMTIASALVAVVQHYVPLFDVPWLARVFSVARVVEPAEGGGYKAGGLHFHRLRYAHTLVPLLAAFVPLIRRRWAIGVTLLSAIGLYFTYTRASWLAVLGTLLAIGLRWHWAWVSVLLIPLVWAGPPDRGVAWSTAKELFVAHPLVGIGYGGYASAAEQLRGIHPEWPLIHLDAHSLLLQLLAEVGAIGTALWAVCVFLYMKKGPNVRAFAALCVLGIVHNWAFHPVVMAGAALALALKDKEEIAQGGREEGEKQSKIRPTGLLSSPPPNLPV